MPTGLFGGFGCFGCFGQRNHYPAMWVLALRVRAYASRVNKSIVHDLAVGRVHRFKHTRLTSSKNIVGNLQSKTALGFTATLAVATNINAHMGVVVA